MAGGSNQRKGALVAGSKTRVQNVTGDQTVKASPGTLHRIIFSNAAAAVGSLTVKDGSTTLIVMELLQDTTLPVEFGVKFTTSIVVTPSAATIDALVIYD